jgi:hypothetical protein
MALIGSLGEVTLPDVVRLLASGRKSGLLTATAEGQQALLRFYKGELVQAFCGRLQGEEAVFDLFGWEEGQLAFVPEDRVVTANVNRPLVELVLEGIRLGPQFHRMNLAIPNDRVLLQMAAGPEDAGARVTLDTGAWRVLRLLDGARDLGEVVAASGEPRTQVVSLLFGWLESGFVERLEPVRSLRVQGQGGGLFGSREVAQMDVRVEEDWKRILRFTTGVRRVEVRYGGRSAEVASVFRSGVYRDVVLPKATLSALGAKEGEEVSVRPVG